MKFVSATQTIELDSNRAVSLEIEHPKRKDQIQQKMEMYIPSNSRTYTLEVSGMLACFTRPEMKVERVSYEVITPSAARAIFEAIYWQPQICWQIVCIEVMNPIAFTHVRRCEVSSMAHVKKEQIATQENRQLRSSLVLRDVCYRLRAELTGTKELTKHCAIFERRARRGQCFTQPYLGCREFAANWRWVADDEPGTPIDESRDLGTILLDMNFANIENPRPLTFRAVMNSGIINVPKL